MGEIDKKEIFYASIANRKLRVLFWDDGAEGQYKTLFTEIKLGFEKYGWEALILTEKGEAVRLALEENFDAVVLDLLHDSDKKPVGLDMLKEIRLKKPFLPLVIFTIALEMVYVQSGMRGDVSYYLTKPIKSYHDVIRAVEVAIEREKTKEKLIQDRYFSSLGKLAAGVAHFVKNSLWNINSRVQMMLEETNKEDKHYELLQTIKRRCDDTNKFVLSLLQYARRGGISGEKKELNIVEITSDVLRLLDQEIKNASISKDLQVAKGEVKLMGIEFELKEAFLNLIKNAIEAMTSGGKLSIEVVPGDKYLSIKVSDTGVGMSQEVLENLFMPFYTTKVDSIGFGLFDTQRIVQKHGGEIKIKSEEGKGSTFTINIPYKEIEEVANGN
ncbi:MAG: hypothetical protein QG657_5803 [Acidobacteriota bacterium]|nr:hypothetical protein [Acidobacteriota bacterium]